MEQAQWELDQLLKLKAELAKTESDKKDLYDARIKELQQIIKAGK